MTVKDQHDCKSIRLERCLEGKGLAINIHLVTAYSCVGVWEHDRVNIIPNNLTPSYIGFTHVD